MSESEVGQQFFEKISYYMQNSILFFIAILVVLFFSFWFIYRDNKQKSFARGLFVLFSLMALTLALLFQRKALMLGLNLIFIYLTANPKFFISILCAISPIPSVQVAVGKIFIKTLHTLGAATLVGVTFGLITHMDKLAIIPYPSPVGFYLYLIPTIIIFLLYLPIVLTKALAEHSYKMSLKQLPPTSHPEE